jgi:outer membrane biosynthesis protein TonB
MSGDRIFSARSTSSIAVGFTRRTIALLVAAVVGLAAVFLLMSGGSGGSIAYATQAKTITAKALTDHECNSTEWHFVITQVEPEANAPASIEVEWANGNTETVPLDKFTGKTAHYRTTSNLNSTVVSATAVIYNGWSGQFNLSHGPCGTPSPTPTKPPTQTPTPTPSPTKSETETPTPTPTPTPSPTKSETHTPTPTPTPTVSATESTAAPTPTPTVGATESTAAPVPTAVPAGMDPPGGGSGAELLGLLLATSGAVAGTAVIGRRRYLHE